MLIKMLICGFIYKTRLSPQIHLIYHRTRRAKRADGRHLSTQGFIREYHSKNLISVISKSTNQQMLSVGKIVKHREKC